MLSDPDRLPSCLSIAFMSGDWRRLDDRLIMSATRGPFVHAEVLLSRGDSVRAYASLEPRGFTVSSSKHSEQPARPGGRAWRLVHFPLRQGAYKPVYALILQLLALNLPYNRWDTWQCCVGLMLPFERDLDCCDLESWRAGGVFCSQGCLLLLRRLGRMGALASPQLVDWRALEATNSRGCSPNALYGLLARAPEGDSAGTALYGLLARAPEGDSAGTALYGLLARAPEPHGRPRASPLARTEKKNATNQGTRAVLRLVLATPPRR